MLILRVGLGPVDQAYDDEPLLRQPGVNAERATSGQEALELMRVYDYDLVVMDLRLPDIEGDEVVRLARTAGMRVPILILGDTTAPQVKIRALNLGADDFLTTPYDIDELLARARAIVRRCQGHAQSVLRAGCVELSLDQREVRVQGQKIPVSRREFGVLELLFLKPGSILNKTAFLRHLYSAMDEPELKTIDVIICRLRKKLTRFGVGMLIDTVWGCGYTLREPAAPTRPSGDLALQLVA